MKKQKTHESRVALGFPASKEEWRHLPAGFHDDKLVIAGHAVMESWERSYMRQLAQVAGSKLGRVLEVGFGMGISSSYLQQHSPEEHVIIEANESVYGKLLAFAAQAKSTVTPMLGFWEDLTRDMPDESFSSILFDTYPLSEDEIHCNHFAFFSEAYRLLQSGGVLTYYSDEEEEFSPEHLSALERAGFRDIQKEICRVNPGEDCLYWRSNSLVVPIIFK